MRTNLIAAALFAQTLFVSCGETKELTTQELTLDETLVISEKGTENQIKNDEPGDLLNHPDSHITEALGDLDKDGIDEKIVVTDTSQEGDFGIERIISIYKFIDNSWQLWHESQGAVLPSKHGGAMGEPFDGITIENGYIVIRHSGGSRTKFSYTHRYRYQSSNWYLIGATISFGEPACAWDTFDYNLLTGNLEVEKYKLNCEAESIEETIERYATIIKINKIPLMDNFYPGDNEVFILEQSDTFYY